MAIANEKIKDVVSVFLRHKKDTGSPEVQVAIFTERINLLTEHLKTHVKDNHSRYGLIKMVGQRKRLLDYVRRMNPERYQKLITHLDLRK